MKIAIMQPYFCAYIGYFQLINSVDKFVIGDDLQYTTRRWFNRNRILHNGAAFPFAIPIKKDSRNKNVNQRFLADTALGEKVKILKRIKNFYANAPYSSQCYQIIRQLFLNNNNNLFDFIYYSINELSKMLDIKTQFILSSSLDIDRELKAQDKIIQICKLIKTDIYINPIGGKELYDKEVFAKEGIDLKFIKSNYIEYPQFERKFVPWLSIIDVLMFNDIEKVKSYLKEYELE